MFNPLRWIFGPKSPEYRRFLVVGKSTRRFLWNREVWDQLKQPIDRLVSDVEAPTGLTTILLDNTRKGPVKQRRFSWKTERRGPSMWNVEVDQPLKFVDIQLECPSFSHMDKTGEWPELFFHILHLTRTQDLGPFLYTQAFHLAVAPRLADRPEIVQILDIVKLAIEPVLCAERTSKWLDRTDSGSINAFLTVGFNYPGSWEVEKPDLAQIQRDWKETTRSVSIA